MILSDTQHSPHSSEAICDYLRVLVSRFCEVGELVEACKIWNLMVMFGTLKLERYHDMGLSSYMLLISWLCRKGKLVEAHMVFGEMLKRGIGADNEVFAPLVYGVVSGGGVREGRVECRPEIGERKWSEMEAEDRAQAEDRREEMAGYGSGARSAGRR
ncbi:hypothetical protein AAC387_Pa02g5193 [Persea americana]